MICDNKSDTHDCAVIAEDYSAIRVYCTQCGAQARIGKDLKQNPELRTYSLWFKRDVLQPGVPLYYKYAGAGDMSVV